MLFLSLFLVTQQALFAQMRAPRIEGKVVYEGEDVIFHEIDQHSWVGSGHRMSSESLNLVEGNDKAVLIDAEPHTLITKKAILT